MQKEGRDGGEKEGRKGRGREGGREMLLRALLGLIYKIHIIIDLGVLPRFKLT